MGSKGSTQVQAPDPFAIAQADATFNRINQFTPAGSLTFSSSGGGLNNNATLALDPRLNALFGQQLTSDDLAIGEAIGRQQEIAAGSLPDLVTGLDAQLPEFQGIGGLPQFQGLEDQDFESARGGVEQALFDRQSSLLQPGFQQSEERLLQSLADRGIPRDSEAGRTEIANFQRERDLTLSNVANSAVLAGGAEQSRLFGLDQSLAGFNNQLAQQGFGNQVSATGFNNQLAQQGFGNDVSAQLQDANLIQANRATQFNELASLLGLQQVSQPGLGNFFAPTPTDVTGAFGLNQQANLANAANSQAQKGGVLGGLTSLGGAALGSPLGAKGAFGL